MKKISIIFIGLGLFALNVQAKSTVNKSLYIDAGERVSGGCSSVNGSITLGEGAQLSGGCSSVNGSIRLERNCATRGINSVNGSIRVGDDCEIRSDIESVNGSIDCANGVTVAGNVQTVNGAIDLAGTTVEEDITTHNGDITLLDRTVVENDIIIKNSTGSFNHRRKPLRIVIDNSVVNGDVINREDDIEVIVYLRNGGQVKGEITDARVEKD